MTWKTDDPQVVEGSSSKEFQKIQGKDRILRNPEK